MSNMRKWYITKRGGSPYYGPSWEPDKPRFFSTKEAAEAQARVMTRRNPAGLHVEEFPRERTIPYYLFIWGTGRDRKVFSGPTEADVVKLAVEEIMRFAIEDIETWCRVETVDDLQKIIHLNEADFAIVRADSEEEALDSVVREGV